MYPSVSILDVDFETKLAAAFVQDGLAVITDILSDQDCDHKVGQVYDYFEQLGTGLDRFDLATWTDKNLPPQTRPGMFQSLVTNIPVMWQVRSHPNVHKVFDTLYRRVKNQTVKEFIVSNDGINVRPNGFVPKDQSTDHKIEDWAHVDQTQWLDDPFKCIQGQIVLTNTTACFRATPGSHKIHKELVQFYKKEDKNNNFLKLEQTDYGLFASKVRQANGLSDKDQDRWQQDILCKKGSMIVWASATIHSARPARRNETPTKDDPFLGSRCVIYVCYRPKEEFTEQQLQERSQVVAQNRTTNHWATHIFPVQTGPRWYYKPNAKHPRLDEMIKDPTTVYTMTNSPPELDDVQKKLAGF